MQWARLLPALPLTFYPLYTKVFLWGFYNSRGETCSLFSVLLPIYEPAELSTSGWSSSPVAGVENSHRPVCEDRAWAECERKVWLAGVVSGCSSSTELGTFWPAFLPGVDWCDVRYSNRTRGSSFPGLQAACRVSDGWKFPLCAIKLVLAAGNSVCSVLIHTYQVLLPWAGTVQGFFVRCNFIAVGWALFHSIHISWMQLEPDKHFPLGISNRDSLNFASFSTHFRGVLKISVLVTELVNSLLTRASLGLFFWHPRFTIRLCGGEAF